jgi:hypothetical protein
LDGNSLINRNLAENNSAKVCEDMSCTRNHT